MSNFLSKLRRLRREQREQQGQEEQSPGTSRSSRPRRPAKPPPSVRYLLSRRQSKGKPKEAKPTSQPARSNPPTDQNEDSTESRRRAQPKAAAAPPPEQTTCSTEAIALIHRIQEVGRLEVDFEEIKAVAKPFVMYAAALGADGVIKQYVARVRAYIPDGTTRISYDRNPQRNRYKDVICADKERVMLKPANGGNGGATDYIHANHVRGSPLTQQQHFICTQAPTANTLIDFWRMVRQENTRAILMLCETKEGGREKCTQYWPLLDNEVLSLDDLIITNRGRFVHEPGFVTTFLEVRDKQTKKATQILHHQLKSWPDRGVPDRADIVLKLLTLIRTGAPNSSVVVHCSAGIGRTGTVIAVEMAIQTLMAGQVLEMTAIVRTLRDRRLHSVQTDLQYAFIYKTVMAFLSGGQPDPESAKAIDDFLDSYSNLMRQHKVGEQPPPQLPKPSASDR